MLGHMSGAYAARVHQDLSLCSRFDFNVYSYESEWTMGAEWWIRRNWAKMADSTSSAPSVPINTPFRLSSDEVQGVIKARASTSNVGRPDSGK
jgi:distribution and morphology protein 10